MELFILANGPHQNLHCICLEALSYDEGSALRDISIITKNVIPFIKEQVIPIFEELEIGPLDKDFFDDLINSEGKAVREKVIKSIEDQLTKGGITSRIIRNNMITKALVPLENLMPEISSFRLLYEEKYIKYISFELGKPILSNANRTALEESYKLYVTSEEGHSLMELHLKAINSINEYLMLIQKKRKLPGPNPWQYLSMIFKINDGDIITLDPPGLNYDAIVSVREVAFAVKEKVKKAEEEKAVNPKIEVKKTNSIVSA